MHGLWVNVNAYAQKMGEITGSAPDLYKFWWTLLCWCKITVASKIHVLPSLAGRMEAVIGPMEAQPLNTF